MKEILFMLSAADGAGSVREVCELAEKELSRYAKTERLGTWGVMGILPGKSQYTIMLDAHMDQVAMVVTAVGEDGFLTVAKAGGIDVRSLPARPVTVCGRKKLPAVFCSTPPHLAVKDEPVTELSELRLDTGLGNRAREWIAVGDPVVFQAEPKELFGTRVTGRSLDDRAGMACLLALAERLSGKELPCRVAIVFSDAEELGLRGAEPLTYAVKPDEGIAVDVSFGDGVGIPETECGRLGEGAMIGVSPALDRSITDQLILLAERNGIAYQMEAMGGRTGTNADKIAVSRGGVKTGTLSIPLRNMHTDAEVLDLEDLKSVCDLLEAYILAGGVMNA